MILLSFSWSIFEGLDTNSGTLKFGHSVEQTIPQKLNRAAVAKNTVAKGLAQIIAHYYPINFRNRSLGYFTIGKFMGPQIDTTDFSQCRRCLTATENQPACTLK